MLTLQELQLPQQRLLLTGVEAHAVAPARSRLREATASARVVAACNQELWVLRATHGVFFAQGSVSVSFEGRHFSILQRLFPNYM